MVESVVASAFAKYIWILNLDVTILSPLFVEFLVSKDAFRFLSGRKGLKTKDLFSLLGTPYDQVVVHAGEPQKQETKRYSY